MVMNCKSCTARFCSKAGSVLNHYKGYQQYRSHSLSFCSWVCPSSIQQMLVGGKVNICAFQICTPWCSMFRVQQKVPMSTKLVLCILLKLCNFTLTQTWMPSLWLPTALQAHVIAFSDYLLTPAGTFCRGMERTASSADYGVTGRRPDVVGPLSSTALSHLLLLGVDLVLHICPQNGICLLRACWGELVSNWASAWALRDSLWFVQRVASVAAASHPISHRFPPSLPLPPSPPTPHLNQSRVPAKSLWLCTFPWSCWAWVHSQDLNNNRPPEHFLSCTTPEILWHKLAAMFGHAPFPVSCKVCIPNPMAETCCVWLQHHAADTYKVFTDTNEDLLKSLPPPVCALEYYRGGDLYMFDAFMTTKKEMPRRPACKYALAICFAKQITVCFAMQITVCFTIQITTFTVVADMLVPLKITTEVMHACSIECWFGIHFLCVLSLCCSNVLHQG